MIILCSAIGGLRLLSSALKLCSPFSLMSSSLIPQILLFLLSLKFLSVGLSKMFSAIIREYFLFLAKSSFSVWQPSSALTSTSFSYLVVVSTA